MRRIIQVLYRSLLLSLLQITWVGGLLAGEQQALQTVPQVNLSRYAGTWYEIARLPNRFQDQCVGNVSAVYRQLDDGNIEVINRCLDKKGLMDEAHGVARVVDPSTNARLEVSFVSVFGWRFFWGDYWILGLGSDYEYAVVGMPSRKYAWVLARSTQIPPVVWSHVQQILIRAGYDPGQLVTTRHERLRPK
jgi:apolipoprotein D and lipocalin family protein